MADLVKSKISDILIEWPGQSVPVDTDSNTYKTWLDKHKHTCERIRRELAGARYPMSFVGPLTDKYSDWIIDLKQAGKFKGVASRGSKDAIILLAGYFRQNRDAATELVNSELTFDQIALRANNMINVDID